MAVTRTVRVITVCDVTVDAEYGDTDEALMAKADPAAPSAVCVETRTLLPEDGV